MTSQVNKHLNLEESSMVPLPITRLTGKPLIFQAMCVRISTGLDTTTKIVSGLCSISLGIIPTKRDKILDFFTKQKHFNTAKIFTALLSSVMNLKFCAIRHINFFQKVTFFLIKTY